MNKDGLPFGSLAEAMAVWETMNGSTGKTHLLERPEYAGPVNDLGTVRHIMELYCKPNTCCRLAQAPSTASCDNPNAK